MPTLKRLPINDRIAVQSSQATIRNLIDAIVELVTNCDDSYNRLETSRLENSIGISIIRGLRGICKELVVKDEAEGLDKDGINKAIEFAGETSGFNRGKDVRGLFGRGLKESIIGLGSGSIVTFKNNYCHKVELWVEDGHPLFTVEEVSRDDILGHRKEFGIRGNGTAVVIKDISERIRIPTDDVFVKQISDHYALRNINSAKNYKIKIIFDDEVRRTKLTSRIEFKEPEGRKIVDHSLKIQGFEDTGYIKVFESKTPVGGPTKSDPYSKAGLLIKTQNAILDHQLFKYDNDPAAHYFWGEVHFDGIADRVRMGDTSIIDFNRAGLQWRHDYCKALQETIERIIGPIIEAKHKDLDRAEESKVSAPAKRVIEKMCSLLNELYKEEIEEDWKLTQNESKTIESLMIKPEFANVELNNERPLSVYVPSSLIKKYGPRVYIESDNEDIEVKDSYPALKQHKSYPLIWYGNFNVKGTVVGSECFVYCTMGDLKTYSKVRVGPQGKRGSKKELKSRKHGFISEIITDETPEPIQRSEYRQDTGQIRIYIKFPGFSNYLKSGFMGVETPEGRTLLAEVISEAFIRTLAIKNIETGKTTAIQGSEIETYNREVFKLQKKFLGRIYEAIAEYGTEAFK